MVSGVVTCLTILYCAYSTEENNIRGNLFRASMACIVALTAFGINSSIRPPFTTIGKIPQLLRGVHMVYLCILIIMSCLNWSEARFLYSVFEDHPTEEALAK